jgi:hypothetical protein
MQKEMRRKNHHDIVLPCSILCAGQTKTDRFPRSKIIEDEKEIKKIREL